ncbi:MAG TPA: hypothetical protein VF066_14480 [Thermoleophilaceae bacterium]
MAKKKFDPKAKAKRQKMIAAVGGVLLLGLLAFQVPRTMKMLKQNQGTSSSSSTAATSTTATPGSTPLAPPALGGSATSGASVASATATSVDGVNDPSNPLPPAAGQLVSFSKFQSKDPFHQQITNCETGADSGSNAGSGSASDGSSACAAVTKAAAKAAAKKTPASGAAVSVKAATTKPASAGPAAPKVTNATIAVNGIANQVSIGSSFPASAPVFTLVSLTPRAAKIGIAGGSYENGVATVTLAKGKTVTLMNTADGMRYVLRLVTVG